MRFQFTIAHWMSFVFMFGLCLGWKHDHDAAADRLADEAVKFHGAQLKIHQLDIEVDLYCYYCDDKGRHIVVLNQQLEACRRDLKWAEERYWKLRGPLPAESMIGGSENEGGCAPAPGGPELMWPDKER